MKFASLLLVLSLLTYSSYAHEREKERKNNKKNGMSKYGMDYEIVMYQPVIYVKGNKKSSSKSKGNKKDSDEDEIDFRRYGKNKNKQKMPPTTTTTTTRRPFFPNYNRFPHNLPSPRPIPAWMITTIPPTKNVSYLPFFRNQNTDFNKNIDIVGTSYTNLVKSTFSGMSYTSSIVATSVLKSDMMATAHMMPPELTTTYSHSHSDFIKDRMRLSEELRPTAIRKFDMESSQFLMSTPAIMSSAVKDHIDASQITSMRNSMQESLMPVAIMSSRVRADQMHSTSLMSSAIAQKLDASLMMPPPPPPMMPSHVRADFMHSTSLLPSAAAEKLDASLIMPPPLPPMMSRDVRIESSHVSSIIATAAIQRLDETLMVPPPLPVLTSHVRVESSSQFTSTPAIMATSSTPAIMATSSTPVIMPTSSISIIMPTSSTPIIMPTSVLSNIEASIVPPPPPAAAGK